MYTYESKLVDSSRVLAEILVTEIGNDPEKFSAMIKIALQDTYPISMRAARIIELCAEKHAELISPYLPDICGYLEKMTVDGVRRSFLKIFAEHPVDIDEGSLGRLTDLAFGWLSNPKEAIAVRYYCIDILLKVAVIYPEICIELSECLEDLLIESSPGLISKSKKVLQKIKKS